MAHLQAICTVYFKPGDPHAAKGVHQLQCVTLVSAPQQVSQQAWNLLLRVVHDVGHIQQPVIEHCVTVTVVLTSKMPGLRFHGILASCLEAHTHTYQVRSSLCLLVQNCVLPADVATSHRQCKHVC